jgi:hypothetical protein
LFFQAAAWRKALSAATPLIILVVIAFIEVPICPTRLAVGVPCPGCGLTRASVAAMQFDVVSMLRFHPLAPILTPLVAWSFAKPVLLALGLVKPEWVRKIPNAPKPVWAALVLAMAVLWVGRLMGYFGGHPDGVDFSEGVFIYGPLALWELFQ